MILQFVGFQNSGKTTAMEWTIQELTAKGFSVIAVKHHGHGGFPDPFVKDSTKYREAGAAASIVEGDGLLHLEITNPTRWNIGKIHKLISCLDYDLLLIEGYKHEHFPKVVFTRSEDDRDKLKFLDNIHSIIPFCKELADKKTYINEIVAWIEDELTCGK